MHTQGLHDNGDSIIRSYYCILNEKKVVFSSSIVYIPYKFYGGGGVLAECITLLQQLSIHIKE